MSMLRRALIAMLIVAVVSLGLTGCDSKEEETPAGAQPDTAAVEAQEEAAEEAPAAEHPEGEHPTGEHPK